MIARREFRCKTPHTRDESGTGLTARRCETPWVRRPRIQRRTRDIIPGPPFPLPEIQLKQTRIDPCRTDRLGNHAAALCRTGPDRINEGAKRSGNRRDVRGISEREIGATVTNAVTNIGAGMADEDDHDAAYHR